MPRWLWALLFALFATLWLASHHGFAPAAATLGGSGGFVACPLPPSLAEVNVPMQTSVHGKMAPFRLGQATISPLAGFSLQARVLRRENYSLDREARYSPTDLALGWGPMAKPGLAEKLDVSQGNRWYRYRWGSEGPPMAPELIARHSANMHMVPADRQVTSALARISEGDTVRIDGWLVRIDGDDGGHWQSSLSRDDQGPGACELIYLCSIQVR